MQMEGYKYNGAPTSMKELRCYSAGKKSKSSLSSSWGFNDPELQRKRRVASYKVYAVEGKMKGSLRKSFRWIKHTCTNVVHGGWW